MQASVRCRHGVPLHPHQTCPAINKLHWHADTVSRTGKNGEKGKTMPFGVNLLRKSSVMTGRPGLFQEQKSKVFAFQRS